MLWTIGIGHALTLLKALPEGQVHTVVTSPPYFRLRDYGTAPQVWGGDSHCTHDWGEPESPRCWMCSAWRGELGRELLVEDYIAHLTLLFREVRRVLHAQGTVWINIGDCYAGSTDGPVPPGYKPKDMIPIPWLLAQSLREDGWWLRSQVIWHKPNARPNSYRDRPVSDYEPVLMLSKQENYYYDYLEGLEDGVAGGQRALRTVWSINTEGSNYSHYACYPRELALRCVRLGTPELVCTRCGAPYRREITTTRGATNEREAAYQRVRTAGAISGGRTGVTLGKTREISRTDGGFVKSCACDGDETLPGIVLDPFGGLMRTGEAALELGRRFIGLELSPVYAAEGRRRLASLDACRPGLLKFGQILRRSRPMSLRFDAEGARDRLELALDDVLGAGDRASWSQGQRMNEAIDLIENVRHSIPLPLPEGERETALQELTEIADEWANQAYEIWATSPSHPSKDEGRAQLLTMWANGVHKAIGEWRKRSGQGTVA